MFLENTWITLFYRFTWDIGATLMHSRRSRQWMSQMCDLEARNIAPILAPSNETYIDFFACRHLHPKDRRKPKIFNSTKPPSKFSILAAHGVAWNMQQPRQQKTQDKQQVYAKMKNPSILSSCSAWPQIQEEDDGHKHVIVPRVIAGQKSWPLITRYDVTFPMWCHLGWRECKDQAMQIITKSHIYKNSKYLLP